jgi:hypothetical protein
MDIIFAAIQGPSGPGDILQLLGSLGFVLFAIGAVIALNATQQISDLGLTPAYQGGITAVDTYTFPNDGRVLLHVKKGANACNVTFTARGSFRGKAVPNQVVAMLANTDQMIGPFPPDLYNDGTGLVTVAFSEVTGLTAAVIRL